METHRSCDEHFRVPGPGRYVESIGVNRRNERQITCQKKWLQEAQNRGTVADQKTDGLVIAKLVLSFALTVPRFSASWKLTPRSGERGYGFDCISHQKIPSMIRFHKHLSLHASNPRGVNRRQIAFRFDGRLFCLAVLSVLMVCCEAAHASDRLNWPVRTGPTLDGHVSEQDAKGLPTEWSEDPARNIAWKLDLEGFGHSVPVIGHGRVWLTSATKDGKQQFLYCVEQATGRVLQHRLLYENAEPEPLMNEINTYASPSCALEDDAVYVHFGTYGTARLDPRTLDLVWDRKDIRCRHYRGPGSSPILWKDLLILTFDGIDAQFLMALNKHTGETVWRTDRTTNYGDLDEKGQPQREGDLRKAYSTPGVIDVNGQAQIVSVGSRAAFAYDALTGKELWTIRHDDFNASSPPAFIDNHAILNTGSRGSNLLSVRLDDSTRGDVSESHVVWNRDNGNSDLSAPILIGNRIFSVLNNGVVTCVNAKTGDEVWKDRIEGTFTASPITANGLIYFCNEEGVCFVIRAAEQFELVSKNTLAEGMRASPSAADGHLFLRTFTRLYAIGQLGKSRK